MTRIGIILGTTRPGRVGPQVAAWAADVANERDDAEFVVLDLADFDLPLFNEPLSPLMGQYEHGHTLRWAAAVSQLDGFLIVTPEYNRSIPAALKNAIDYLYAEWHNKAIGIISYGSQVGGARAAEHLRLIMAGLHAATVKSQVSLSLATDFEAFVTFTPSPRTDAALAQMVGEVVAWSKALATLREP